MDLIKLTKKNIEDIDCNQVAFYSYAEPGAMGVHAGIIIVTFDKKAYEGTYMFGKLNYENFFRALPSLIKNNKEAKERFFLIYMGMGNHLYIRKEIFDDFNIKLNEEIDKLDNQDKSHRMASIYSNWLRIALDFLNNYKVKDVKPISVKENEILNPFYAIGYNLDINDRNFQKTIVDTTVKNAQEIIKGYDYNCYNYYGKQVQNGKEVEDGFQIAYYQKPKEELTLTEKFNRVVVHHTGNIVWENLVETVLSNDVYIVRPMIKEPHGAAIVQYINQDFKPYITTNSQLFSQINCIAYDFKSFHDDSLGDNNFSFMMKSEEGKEDKIYLKDNCIMLAGIFNKNPLASHLNYVRGRVIETKEGTSFIFGKKETYHVAVLDTEFGPTPVMFSENSISYSPDDNTVKVGDFVEALVSITGDLMLYREKAKAVYDKGNLFDIVRKSFERKDMSYLENVLADDCEYHSDCNDIIGKAEIIKKLQHITNVGYEKEELQLKYAMIDEYPVKHFKIGDEVLCLCKSNDFIEGEINIEVQDNKISRIYLTNDEKIKFFIYSDDGEIGLSEKNRLVLKELLDLLKEKELSEADIWGILAFLEDNAIVAKKLIKFVNKIGKTEHLCSDILGEENKLIKKFDKNHPHMCSMKKHYSNYVPANEKDNDNHSIYTLHYRDELDNGVLDVSTNDSDIGELRILKRNKLNFVSVKLELAFMNLDDLKNDTRENFKPIDLYHEKDEEMDYSFKKAALELEKGLDKYKEIVLWLSHDDTSSCLMPYYFINRFYNQIKDKDIYIIYTDEFKGERGLRDLKIGEFDKLVDTKKKLSKKEINHYNEEWNKIVNIKCDIRSLEDNKLTYKNIEDYYDEILKFIPTDFSIKRTKLIGDLMVNNVLTAYSCDMYSYIIDRMIEAKILTSKNFKIPQFIPADDITINKGE